MKKFIAKAMVVIAMVMMALGSSVEAKAENHARNNVKWGTEECREMVCNNYQQRLYADCRDKVREGDRYYREHNFRRAVDSYREARKINDKCENRYISNEELEQRLDDCFFAINHNGQTRHEVKANRDRDTATTLTTVLVSLLGK